MTKQFYTDAEIEKYIEQRYEKVYEKLNESGILENKTLMRAKLKEFAKIEDAKIPDYEKPKPVKYDY